MSSRLICLLLSVSALASCGHAAKPPFESSQPRDASMSCAELAVEVENMKAIRQRAWDALGPSSPMSTGASFIGGMIGGALNLSHSEAELALTVRAVDGRLPYLAKHMQDKKCS